MNLSAISHTPVWLGLVVALTACDSTGIVTRKSETTVIKSHAEGPPDAPLGSCWGRDSTPATIETVTEHILVQPAELDSDGSVRQPAIYRKVTSQDVIRERREIWFETPCPDQLDAAFVTSVQRALMARGYYKGPLDGEISNRTRRAVRAFQKEQGLDSAILSLAAARQLGLVTIARPE